MKSICQIVGMLESPIVSTPFPPASQSLLSTASISYGGNKSLAAVSSLSHSTAQHQQPIDPNTDDNSYTQQQQP